VLVDIQQKEFSAQAAKAEGLAANPAKNLK
jgi:hypothetical protein